MILSINHKDKVLFLKPVNRTLKTKTDVLPAADNKEISGVPRSYISFKQNKTINYTEDATRLIADAAEVAKQYNHSEILPQHIIQASIEHTNKSLETLRGEVLDSGVVISVSTISKLANDITKTNLLETPEKRKFFNLVIKNLAEDNKESLANIPADENFKGEPKMSLLMEDKLREESKKVNSINASTLLDTALSLINRDGESYTAEFLISLKSYASYKGIDEINKNYMKVYDNKAIDLWNKLALGSNMIVTYSDPKEVDRIAASLIYTINSPKHGNFNDKNTSLYVMSDNITDSSLLMEISGLKECLPEIRKIVMVNLDKLFANSRDKDELETFDNIVDIVKSTDENLMLVFFQKDDVFYKVKSDSSVDFIYKNMVTYAIPQIQTYEVRKILDKKLIEDVKTTFTKDAKDRIVFHAANINGIFPDKAVDLMKRISNYYGDSKKKITAKEVDEFAHIGYELFSVDSNNARIIYDTGKSLDSLYGKETVKKDIEAIIRQIKTGRIGTKGIIISSRDNEAGSGRRYTAETIAGEAKVPFMAIDTSDFALAERDSDGATLESPKNQMSRIFSEIKNAARQNQYKTAIIYVNNFEEFAFSNPYLPGYRQAMSKLMEEMQNAMHEDVNILVIGSADDDYVAYIPKFVRDFSQFLSVDSPAYNKRGRKEILTHRINDVGMPLAYRTLKQKEHLIERLVKLTENMSYVEIKSLIDKTTQIMSERNKLKASMGDFIEAFLQLTTGRTSRPDMPDFNKQVTTSHECGHATNLEVMNDLLERRGRPWHQFRNVNFITLDPRGDFLGAVFEDHTDNTDYPFEAMFTALVCSYGGYSCEKLFYNMDGSAGILQDLAQATATAKNGVEYFGFGANTGKISNAVNIKSPIFYEKAYRDMDVILNNAKTVSDLITEVYKSFNEWFTQKYSKLIGTDDCMVDGDDFRRSLSSWKKSLSADKKKEISTMEDIIMDIIESAKKGIKY